MKKYALLLVAFIMMTVMNSYGQCIGTPNPACINTSGPCGAFNPGTVGQYYLDTITFFAPPRVDASVQSNGLFDTLDLIQFKITNVTGLPLGIAWSCGNGSCIYNPQPNGILSNITVCGTPISAGTYNITIHTQGTVSTPFGPQSGTELFVLPLIITNGSGGNSAFTFAPAQGCETVTSTFSPIMNFPLPQITEWIWDFGNSNTFNGQNPPPVTFNTPGIYPVTCTTNVYNLRLTNLSLNVCGQSWWCGDVEELNCANGNADIVPTFTTGSSNWTGPEVSNNCQPSWSNINFVLTSTSYSISMVEIDAISANDYPAGPYAGNITGPGTYGFNYPGNYSGSFTIGTVLANQIIVTDTIIVYGLPANDTIDATFASICPGDSTTLSVYPNMLYEWILNDTLVVQQGFNHTYTTAQPGSYTVNIIDPVSGCYVTTMASVISPYQGLPPGFPNVGISFDGTTITTPLTGQNTYQWLYWNGNSYNNIPAPEGTASSYTPQFNGTYCLIATNQFGCTDTSNCISIENLSTDDPFESNKVAYFPNPSDGIVNLQIPYCQTDLQFRVYNMIGQVLLTETIYNPQGQLARSYDFSRFGPGIYVVELVSGGYRDVQRVVIR